MNGPWTTQDGRLLLEYDNNVSHFQHGEWLDVITRATTVMHLFHVSLLPASKMTYAEFSFKQTVVVQVSLK